MEGAMTSVEYIEKLIAKRIGADDDRIKATDDLAKAAEDRARAAEERSCRFARNAVLAICRVYPDPSDMEAAWEEFRKVAEQDEIFTEEVARGIFQDAWEAGHSSRE